MKQFLLQYSLLRRKEGFVLRHDSLASGGMGMSSERVMGANSGCFPKQMGHMVLPDVLCTSSGSSLSTKLSLIYLLDEYHSAFDFRRCTTKIL